MLPMMSGADVAPEEAFRGMSRLSASDEELATTPLPQPAGLPIPRLARPFRIRTAHYFVVTVNQRGRLSSRLPARMLGWLPGHRLDIVGDPAAIAIVGDPHGRDAITQQGHIRLPNDARRTCRLASFDQLLMVIYTECDMLVAYPMPAVDAMVTAYDARLGADIL
jgi:hypothetical protein